MPTFQDARDGLDALLKDGKRNLSLDDRDKAITDAARAFSRRRPRLLSVETTGDDGFEYTLPIGYVEGFSSIQAIYFPWDPTDQFPQKLEPKQFRVFDGPSGVVFRFRAENPSTSQKFLTQFTAPHTASADPADEVGVLDAAGRVVDGSEVTSTNNVDVESAADVQLFFQITAAVGTSLDIIFQAS